MQGKTMSLFHFKFLPIHLAILAIILNNWQLSQIGMNFSDPLIIVGLILLLSASPRLTPTQAMIITAIPLVVGMNVLIASFENVSYSATGGMIHLFKVTVYALFSVLLFNYVNQRKFTKISLKILILWTSITCVIGLYITIIIQSGIGLPYDFFWEFTRSDEGSYTSGGTSNVIRTRSIFAEPQHLGFFLNTVLLFSLFNTVGYKSSRILIALIAITAITTYSFSTIPMTFLILAVYFIKRYRIGPSIAIATGVLVIFGTTGTALLSRSFQATVVDRFERITSGEDTSANARLLGSWEYVNDDNFFTGNGIGSTPPIFNNYAYIITELGIVPLILVVILTYSIFRRNIYFGLYFVYFTAAKGGYLSAFYWLFLALFFLYSVAYEANSTNSDESPLNRSKHRKAPTL